jgi:hypothetical protein
VLIGHLFFPFSIPDLDVHASNQALVPLLYFENRLGADLEGGYFFFHWDNTSIMGNQRERDREAGDRESHTLRLGGGR